jgi:endonuclease V-like protein UPF0215 family
MRGSFKRNTLAAKRFRCIKREIRVLGVDDGIFVPHTAGKVDVVGVVYRGGYWFDGVMRTEVTIDGLDATGKIAEMIRKAPQYEELRVVMLNGITFAGFNVVDIKELFKMVNLPVIAVARVKPDLEKIRKALENLTECRRRWQAVESAGKIIQVQTRKTGEAVYMQATGISWEDAEKILKITSTRSSVPEALRVAHMIASGLTQSGEKV